MNKCKDCKFWVLRYPPSLGDCKKDNKATLYNDNCKKYEGKTSNSVIEDLFKGFKA